MERECGPKELFSEEELREISGVIVGDDYVEVMCGCTSHRYGDAIARLRVFSDGDLQITCQCTPACKEDKLTPAAFEKHSERESSRNWRNNVWVFIEGDKVALSKTVLLRYYNQTLKKSSKDVNHRDEFVECSRCGKERRFKKKSRGECRMHHDALADPTWKCCDYPYDKITCEEEEERGSRKVYGGCSRSSSCKGCTSCVCFGCNLCRFSDCNCQTCLDFTANAQPI
ncbi:unnamed protein product [Microthlaspi erraticum]|uniref:SAND domain-containing protein n=1 Tax=Microthlaspi erraticum TaxID=1685480 RepID=A0A6D2HI93_9BRAS|nr:unnamed protein product [Microthlaspi erraticum]